MDIKDVSKYLRYLISEIDKYLGDGRATDNEMIQFINELAAFQDRIEESDLPELLLIQIRDLKFNYSVKQIDRSYIYFFFAYLTFGLWAFIVRFRNKNKQQ